MPNPQSDQQQRIAPSTVYEVPGSPDQYRFVLRGADLVLIDQNNQEQVFMFVGNIMSLDGSVNMNFSDGQTLDSQELFTRSEMEDMELLDHESNEWEVESQFSNPVEPEDAEGNTEDGTGLLPPAEQSSEVPAQSEGPKDPTDELLEMQRKLITEMSEKSGEGGDLSTDIGMNSSSSSPDNNESQNEDDTKEDEPDENDGDGPTEYTGTGNTTVDSPTIKLAAASDSGLQEGYTTNDQHPSFQGTSTPGSSVEIYVDNELIETVVTDEDGNFNSEATYNLNGGDYLLHAVTVYAGGESFKSTVHELTIDIVAPDLPTLELSSSSNTSTVLNGSVFTKDTTPSLHGAGGDPDSTVTLYISGDDGATYTELATVDVGSDGSWSYTLTSSQELSDGEYIFRLSSTDLADNTAPGYTYLDNINIKTDNPTSTLSLSAASDSMDADAGGTAGDLRTNADTLVLTAEASDDTSGVEIFMIGNGSYISLGQAAKSGDNWVFTVQNDDIPTDGPYRFVAQATDVAGNVEVIQSKFGLEVVIDRTPPTVTPAMDLDAASDSSDSGHLLGSDTDDYTNENTITINGTAGPDVPVDVYLSVDGGTPVLISDGVIRTDAFGVWNFTYDVTSYGLNGTESLTFTAQVLDPAANVSESTLTVDVDHTAPDIPTINLVNALGTVESDIDEIVATVRNTSAVLQGVVTEGSNDIILTVYAVDGNGVRTAIADNLPGGATGIVTIVDNGNGTYSWSYDYGAIADGQSYTFVVTAEDAAGNFSTRDSRTLIIHADTSISAPALELDAGTDTGGGPDGTVGDDYTGFVDGDPDNPLELKVSGDDNSTITVYLLDGSAPGAEAIISGGVTIGMGVLVGVSEQDVNDDWPLVSFDASGYAGTTTDLTFVAVSEDKAGNNAYTQYTVTLDDVDPSAGPIDLDDADDLGSSATDNITSATELMLRGSLDEGADAVKVTIFDHGVELGEATVTDDGMGGFQWTYELSAANGNISEGGHSYTAVVEDNAGNQTTLDALPVIIDWSISDPTFALTSGDGSSDTGRDTSDRITNATDLVFEGSSDIGDTVTVYRGATAIGSFVAATANWTYTVAEADAPEGEYDFSVTTVDTAGNTASSTPETVTIDRSTDTPGNLDLDSGSDTYYVDGAFTADTTDSDNETSATSLVITGQVAAGGVEAYSVVNLYIQGETDPVGSVTVGEEGTTWSITVNNSDIPTDGDYDFYVRYVDLAGNESDPSADLTVTIDRTAPDDPGIDMDGANHFVHGDVIYTNENEPTFTLSDLEVGTHLNVKLDGVSISTPEVNNGTMTLDLAAVGAAFAGDGSDDGTHTISVIAVDGAGNDSNVIEYSFVLDTGAEPISGVRLDAGSDSGQSDSDDYTNETAPTIIGSAEANSTVTVSLMDEGNNVVFTDTVLADGTGNWSVTVPGASPLSSEEAYTVNVSATDYANNVATDSSYSFTLDTSIDPVDFSMVESAFNDTGAYQDDQITGNRTPQFTWDSQEDLTATISIFDESNNLVHTYTQDSPQGVNTWTVPPADALADGTYTVRATFLDAAGNTVLTDGGGNVVTEEVTVTIDTSITTPTFVLTSGDGSSDTGRDTADGITNATELIFNGTSNAGDTVTVYRGDEMVESFVVATASWTYTLENQHAPEGEYAFHVTTVDTAGNTASSTPVTVTIDRSTDTPGNLDLDSGSDTYYVDGAFTADTSDSDNETSATSLIISGQVAAGGVEANSVVNLYIDGVNDVHGDPKVIGSATVGAEGTTWSIAVLQSDIPADGNYDFYVRYVDLAGNVSDVSSDLTVIIDRTEPDDPGIAMDGANQFVHDDVIYTNENEPTFTLDTLEVGTHLNIKLDGVSISTPEVGSDTMTLDLAALGAAFADDGSDDGTHTITVVAVDGAGNDSNVIEYSFVLDTSAEAITDVRLDAGSDSGQSDSDDYTNVTAPTITGSAEANSTVTVTLVDEGNNVVFTDTVLANGTGDWSVTVPGASPLSSEEVYTVNVSATDYANNVATDSSYSFTLDTSIDPVDFAMVETEANDTGAYQNDRITSNRTPQFTWDSQEDLTATISIFDESNNLVHSYSVNSPLGENTWSVPSGDALADGTYTVRATFLDAAGNTVLTDGGDNVVTEEVSVTIDTSIATPTFVLTSGDGSSDTGRDTADGVTNATELIFNGTSNAGDTVTVYRGGVEVESFVVATASWTYTLESQHAPEGEYAFHVTTVDTAGNTASSTPVTVTIDRSTDTPGDLDLDSGSDTYYVDGAFTAGTSDSDNETSATSLVITGQVAAGGVEAYSVVNLYIDGVEDVHNDPLVIGSATVGAEGTTWSITVPQSAIPADGDYDFYVRYVDLAGNVSGVSSDLNVIIDRTAPDDPGIDMNGANHFVHDDVIYTSENEPTFTLSDLEVGTYLNIKLDGVSISTPLVGSETMTLNLAALGASFAGDGSDDGEHTISVVAVDGAGNDSNVIDYSFVLDMDSTDISGVRLDTDSNTGDPNDTITYDTTPTIIGWAEAGADVVVKLLDDENNVVFTDTVVADGAGSWSVSVPEGSALSEDGVYTVDVTATDHASNEARDDSYSFTLDTIIDPVNFAMIETEANDTGFDLDDRYTHNQNPSFSWTTTEDLTVTISIFDEANNLVHSYTEDSPQGPNTWTVPGGDPLADGTYTVKATFLDTAGNTVLTDGEGHEVTEEVTVTIDTVAPVLSVELADGSDSGVEDDWMTNGDKVVAGLELTGDGEQGSRIYVYVNDMSNPVQQSGEDYITVDGSNSWTFDLSALQIGSGINTGNNSIKVVAEDQAGNKTVLTETLVVDTAVSPVGHILLADESDSGYKGDFITNDMAPTLYGITESNATVVVTVDIGGVDTAVGTVTADGNGDWTLDVPANLLTVDGSYTFTATITDRAGNEGTTTRVLTIDTDLTAPSVAMADDTYGTFNGTDVDFITNDTTPQFTVTTEVDTSLEIFLDDVSVYSLARLANTTGTITYSQVALTEGSYTFRFVSTDSAGNTSETVQVVEIDPQYDPADLTVAMHPDYDTGESNADGLTNEPRPVFSGTAEAGSKVRVYFSSKYDTEAEAQAVTFDAGDYKTEMTLASAQTVWEYSPSALTEDGFYKVTVISEDEAGNQQTKTTVMELDTTPPEVPSFELTEDGGNSIISATQTTDNTPGFTGTAEPGSTVTVTVKELESDQGVLMVDVEADGTGHWFYQVENADSLADGSYNVVVTSTDEAGNVAEGTAGFMITGENPVPPTISLSSDDDSNIDTDGVTSQNNALTLTGIAQSHCDVQIWRTTVDDTDCLGGELVTTVEAGGNGVWSADLSGTLADGSYYYYAKSEYSQDNVFLSDLYTLTVDSTTITPTLELQDDTGVADEWLDPGPNNTDEDWESSDATITGTVDEGATVVITATNNTTSEVTTVTIAPENLTKTGDEWTYHHDLSALGDGEFDVQVTTTDLAGNTASSAVQTMYFDSHTVKPTVDLPDAQDTELSVDTEGHLLLTNGNVAGPALESHLPAGFISTMADGYTRVNHLVLTGTAEPEALVRIIIYKDGDDFPSPAVFEAEADGTWTFDTGLLEDGMYTFEVTTTDMVGNEMHADSLNVYVDASPTRGPAIAMYDGIDGTNDTPDTTPTFTLYGDSDSVWMLYLDGEADPIATGTFNAGTSATSVTPGVTAGIDMLEANVDHSLVLVTVDRAGNVAVSGQFNFEIDTIAPEQQPDPVGVTGTSTIVPADGADPMEIYTNDNDPTITIRVEAGTQARMTGFGDNEWVADTDNDGLITFTVPANAIVDQGSHAVSVEFRDAAHNHDVNEDLDFLLVVDTSKPATTIELDTSSDLGFSDSDAITSGDQLVLSGDILELGLGQEVGDFSTGIADYSVTVTNTTTGLSQTIGSEDITLDGDGNWTLTYGEDGTPLDSGHYEATLTASDMAGNAHSSTAEFDVQNETLDTPDPTLMALGNTGYYLLTQSDYLPDGADHTQYKYELTYYGKDANGDDVSLSMGEQSFNNSGGIEEVINPTLHNEYDYVGIKVIDYAGNESTPCFTDIDTTDVDFSATVEVSDTVAQMAVSITGDTDNDGIDDVTLSSMPGEVTLDGDGHWTWDFAGTLDSGDYTLHFEALDGDGNAVSASESTYDFSVLADELNLSSDSQDFSAGEADMGDGGGDPGGVDTVEIDASVHVDYVEGSVS